MGKTSKGINYDIIRPDKQSKKAPTYNKGGRVLRDKGTPKSGEKGFKHKGTLQKINKKIFGKNRKRYDEQAAKTDVHHPAVIRELKKKGLTSKKVEEDILKEKMKSL